MKVHITFMDKTNSVFDVKRLIESEEQLTLCDGITHRHISLNEVLTYKIRRGI